MIKLEKRKVKTKFKSPLLNFSIDEQEIEFRKDPLTERWTRVNINRTKRPYSIKKDRTLDKLIRLSKENCPFCSAQIESSTSKFVNLKERFKVGESVLFPNIYPYSKYHAVVVISEKKHYISLEKMSTKLLFDSLSNSIEFFKSVNKKDSKFVYPSINFNYMPPAAASIFHPHFQILVDDRPTFMTNSVIKKSLEYYRKTKTNFWFDLINLEKRKGERFIGCTKNFCWISDFAPMKNNEVSGIHLKKSSLTDLDTKEIKNLAKDLSNLFKKLWKIGVRSLTMSTFSGPMGKNISDYFLLNLKFLSRPILSEFYTADIGYMELLQQESVVETLPENVAKSLRFT